MAKHYDAKFNVRLDGKELTVFLAYHHDDKDVFKETVCCVCGLPEDDIDPENADYIDGLLSAHDHEIVEIYDNTNCRNIGPRSLITLRIWSALQKYSKQVCHCRCHEKFLDLIDQTFEQLSE